MKLCESFFPFRLECVRVTASCVPPDRRSEDFALRHRVHSLTLSSILRQFLHICVKPRPPSLRDISVKILFPPFCLVAEQKVMQCGMHKQTTLTLNPQKHCGKFSPMLNQLLASWLEDQFFCLHSFCGNDKVLLPLLSKGLWHVVVLPPFAQCCT